MSDANHRLSIGERVGYSLGDAAANFVWRSTFFLPIFYTDTFGLTAAQVAVLLLVIRLSDGVTDIIMGSIADRTKTAQGKFRPWVLWSAPVLGLFLALLFTTPNLGQTGKLAYAYVIYFGLTLAYTANNVPYGALMGVMTPSVKERALLSGYRFVGAFGGGLLVMGLLPTLVDMFGQQTLGGQTVVDPETCAPLVDQAVGYQYTMAVFAVLLVAFCFVTYATTRERIKPPNEPQGTLRDELGDLFINLPVILIPVIGVSLFLISLTKAEWPIFVKVIAFALLLGCFGLTLSLRTTLLNKPDDKRTNTQRDLADLLSNTPWLTLLLIGVLFGMFTVVRPSTAAYYFEYFLHRKDLIGIYFAATLVASLVAALVTGYATRVFSKRGLFAVAFGAGAIVHAFIYWVQPQQVVLLFVIAIIGEFFAGMMPVLFFSMLGDAADFSEWKNNRRATGLVFSAGTFINKTGHGFAGATVMLVLSLYGYHADSLKRYGADYDRIAACQDDDDTLAFEATVMAAYRGDDAAKAQVTTPCKSKLCEPKPGQVKKPVDDTTDEDDSKDNEFVPEAIPTSVEAMKLLMSLIPAILAALGLLTLYLYPLTNRKMEEIEADLIARRAEAKQDDEQA